MTRTRSTSGWAWPALAALLGAVAGCGGDDVTVRPTATTATTTPAVTATPTTIAPATTTPTTGAPTTGAPTTAAAPTTTPPVAEDLLVRLWFVGGDRLTPVHRVVAGPESAVLALLAGPDGGTTATTAIPRGTGLRSFRTEGATAVVDLTGTFASGGGSASMQLRVGQLVATVVDLPGIDRMQLLLDGEPATALGGEGLLLDQPLDEADIRDVRALIVVDEPVPGAVVSSPLVVRGGASAFESQFLVELRAADGTFLAGTPVLASGAAYDEVGRPVWAPYEVELRFDPGAAVDGVLVAYDRSEADGSVIDVFPVPVRFVAGVPYRTVIPAATLPDGLPGTE